MIEMIFRQVAPEGSRYVKGAFAGSLGQQVPFRMDGVILQAVVTDVMVNEGGHWALITVQLPVTFPPLLDNIPTVSLENDS
jgi:hypothetical protein